MAKIPFQKKTEVFNQLAIESTAAGENNDCTVKAVAIVCGVSYAEAHTAMKSVGRKNGEGSWSLTYAVEALGFKMVYVNQRTIINKYPKPHDGLQSITTHHPDRFWKVWQDGKTYIMQQNGHVSAIVNGVNHDWTRGRAKRCYSLYEIVKK